MYVVVGSNSLRGNSSTKNSYSVQKVFPHKDFNFKTVVNDIGLILLNDKIEYNKKVKAIELPLKKKVYEANYTATATGWGIQKVQIFYKLL